MRFLPLALFVVFTALPFNQAHVVTPANATYTVYMPTRYQPGGDYDIYVIVNLHREVIVEVYVNKVKVASGIVKFEKSLIISFSTSRFTKRWNNKVRVVAKVKRGTLLFDSTRRIYKAYNNQYGQKSSAMFIQKDKPFYKPKDKVRFRCFGLNSNLLAIREPITIKILDPFGNLMEYWANETSKTGVISKGFDLSDKPVLGDWKIICSQGYTKGSMKTEKFPVREYVLPPIKVSVTGDKYICHLGLPAFFLAERYIDILINARYSFGGPVKGTVHLRMTINEGQKISYQKVLRTEGLLTYRFYLRYFFNIRKVVKIYRYAGMPSYISLTVVAKVIEDETGLAVLSPPMFIRLVRAPVEISSPYQIYVKPGLTTQFQVDIKRIDGRPLTWDDVKNQLKVTFISKTSKFVTMVFIPLDGVVIIVLPPKNYDRIQIAYVGYYQGYKYILYRDTYLRLYHTSSPSYMQVSLKKSNCFAGDALAVLIQGTTTLTKCYYLIIKDGQFIDSGCVYVFGMKITVLIKTTKNWIPYIRIVFTCYTIENDILVDVLPIKLCTEFRYKVGGMYTPWQNRAGQKTILKMSSARGSTLFIMAVDERLEFLKKPTYISKDGITKAFNRRTDTTVPNYVNDVPTLLRWCHLTWISNKIKGRVFFPGPRRFAAVGKSVSHRGPVPSSVKLRDDFQEVWIWLEMFVSSKGFIRIPKITPDSITTWITNAFALHPTQGISVLDNPLEFLSFQRMFLILNLPYCVIRYERLFINVIVFNYLPTSHKVLVQIKNVGLVYQDTRGKIITVEAKSYKGVKFSIRPTVVGNIVIELDLYIVNGKKRILMDRLAKVLKVKPEGRTLYFSNEYMVDMKNGSAVFPIIIRIPKIIIVPGSVRIEICVTGDILGPVIEGLGKLVRLPSGCGEQTALSLVPNIYIYVYLKARNALDAKLKKKLIKFTKSGYQNQLRYQRPDGSYSAFQSDKQGSVWLTAFITKSFQLVIDSGMPVVIDVNKLRLSLRWLLRSQRSGGDFKETGRVIHKNMQGGSSKGIPLTAYVLKALITMKSLNPKGVSRAIVRAEAFLATVDLKKLDVYTLCILLCTYSKLNNIVRFKAVEMVLLPRATVVGNMMYWKGKYDIEQTAYALLAYACIPDIIQGNKILKWLLSKRNSLGGYSNTQNTVVALEAITKFSLLLKQTSKAIIRISDGQWSYNFKRITAKNMYVLQKKVVPNTARVIKVTAIGDGVAYITAVWQYNVYFVKDDNFGLAVSVETKLSKALIIIICFRWKLKTPHELLVSRMNLPSGFEVQSIGCKDPNCDKYKNCTATDSCLSKTEIENDNVNLYLEQLPYNKGVYVIITLGRRHSVDNKDTKFYVTTSSYYSDNRLVVSFDPFAPSVNTNIPF